MNFKKRCMSEIVTNYDLNSYWYKINETNFIIDNEAIIGFIDYHIDISSQLLYIDMVEVIDKNIGYGKKIIDYIFTTFNDIEYISGIALNDSFKFWESIGCSFNLKTSKAEYVEIDKCCNFTLVKSGFYKDTKFRVEYYVNKKDCFIIDCNYKNLNQAIDIIKEIKEDGDTRGERSKIYYRKFPLNCNKKVYLI